MNMDKVKLFDAALDKLMGDMDDMEGTSAMAHSQEECPDPLGCKMHDGELGKELAPEGGEPAAVKIEIKKLGMPSLDGAKEGDGEGKAEEGLSPEDEEALKKLLK